VYQFRERNRRFARAVPREMADRSAKTVASSFSLPSNGRDQTAESARYQSPVACLTVTLPPAIVVFECVYTRRASVAWPHRFALDSSPGRRDRRAWVGVPNGGLSITFHIMI
jgi:hypothetical protein